MPAIRDWSYNYGSTTTATTIVVPLPKYVEGDLLLAILSADTGTTQAWSCSGWIQLFSQSNTSNLAVMYKIAGSSESDPTFTYTIAESANGAIFSIRDVDISSIFADYDTANESAARQAMPVSVAARNNSLIIYCWSNASLAVVPSVIEGPVTQVCAKDGFAHSDGIAWGFQASLGNTPSNVYITISGTTYTGKVATLVINPPATGATVIPVYCAADSSIYVDPIHGVTAFRGNTAFAGTATTYFGATLAGKTLANATASAKTDYGINTFRSCGGMTGPTAANTWMGATTVLATGNKPDVSGKNVLVHAMPLIPADLQTIYYVGLGKGTAVGMFSSANNCKTWHVHGFGTPWGINRVPIIIHPDNSSGLIDTQGTLVNTSVLGFGFFTCGFLVSSDWTWTMIWVLDTTVVAGGNASEPIDIGGIVTAVADGHERMSVIRQAANQMLLLQPIQIGNGGANPTYLKLDSTAIEFPEIYNTLTKQVYYCSIPNVAGITYYAGATDTIIHRNSIISSPSKYFWKFDPSSSTSAFYDFKGLTIIGAGTITLKSGITLEEITWASCDEIAANGVILDYCNIKNSTSTNAFSVASPSEMGAITNCYFEGNTNAIKISAAGDYDFVGITFFNNIKDVNVTAISGVVNIYVTGGGDTPTYQTAGATVNIYNQKTLTLDGLIAGSEIEILLAGTQTELAHEETSGVSYAFPYDWVASFNIDIFITKNDYEWYAVWNHLLPNANSTLPISQRKDRVYNNPP